MYALYCIIDLMFHVFSLMENYILIEEYKTNFLTNRNCFLCLYLNNRVFLSQNYQLIVVFETLMYLKQIFIFAGEAML